MIKNALQNIRDTVLGGLLISIYMIIKVFIIIVSIWFVLGIGIKLIEKPMVNYVWNKSDQKSAELERHFEDTYGRFQDEQRSIELKKMGEESE